jgi:UDP-3-O-[3-hydroxymyristoyl] glucosamine N-acyltransferase
VDEKITISELDRDEKRITFAEVAERVGGELAGLDEDFVVKGVTTLEDSEPGWVSFLGTTRFLEQAKASKASGFIVTKRTVVPERPCIVLDDVWKGMLFLLDHFHAPAPPRTFVHPTALVGSNVSLGNDVSIGPYVVVENDVVVGDRVRVGAHGFVGRGARIGDDTLLHPRVTLLARCELGARVIVHPGVVIGADGFKYEFIDKQLTKIPQVGRVVVEDDVEIGANTCIDRASFTATRIGCGTKIDNLVQIAHNVCVGAGSVIVSQAGIAGSTRLGEQVFLAGQVGLVDNIEIGDRAKIGAQAGVKNDVPPDVYYLGSPAMPAKKFMAITADLNKLGEMRKRLRELEEKVAELGTAERK